MIRVDPKHWTADFRLARALAEAYAASGLDDLAFFCTGDPGDPLGRLGPWVGDEMLKYYPHVVGTSDRPVVERNCAERAEELFERWPGAFVIGIEVGASSSAYLGSIEVSDRGLRMGIGSGAGRVADVTVSAILSVDEEEERRVRRRLEAAAARGEPVRPGRESLSEGLRAAAMEVGSDDEAFGYPGKKFVPLRPEQVNEAVVRRLADTVIDGGLRLLSKIGKQPI